MTDALDAFRTRCREFVDAHRHMEGRHQPGETDDESRARAVAYQQALADAGLAGITFPVEYGGAGLTVEHQRVFNEEAEGFESPASLFMIGLGMCAPTILMFGTEEQKRALLPGLLRADTLWCQLFSEPGAGSDIASLQTRAVREHSAGDEWVVNGQKVWTSGAHYCDYGLMLARTNPDVPKHRGISMFVVPCARRVSTRSRCARSTAARTSTRCSSPTRAWPRPRCSARSTRAGGARSPCS